MAQMSGHDRECERARVPVEQHRGDDERDAEELEHAARAIRDVAHGLGEADDVDPGVLVLELAANRFQLPRHLPQVETLARLGIVLLQGCDHHGGTLVVRHDAADPVRLEQVLAHAGELLRAAVEVGRDDVAAAETVLDHFVVADVGREERGHRAALDALDEEHLLRDLAERLHEFLVEDVAAAAVVDRDQHAIGAAEVRLELQEGLHVLVVERDHLGEARLYAQLARHCAEQDRHQDEDDQQELAPAEDPEGDPPDPALHEAAALQPRFVLLLVAHVIRLASVAGGVSVPQPARPDRSRSRRTRRQRGAGRRPRSPARSPSMPATSAARVSSPGRC